MVLKEYRRKRNFKKTTEPLGTPIHRKGYVFVVQKHAATHLHYDFRLEVNGVLKSWAIPKGPSLNPNDKRLAIMVEDHPFEYRDFEGVIPEGNYGAGTVMVWDTGLYYPLDYDHQFGDQKDMVEALNKGTAVFLLEGKKLSGLFSLVKLKNRPDNQWLFMKLKDPYASATGDIMQQDRSVLSHRTMDEIARELKGDPPSKMPKKIVPMLAYLADGSFDDEEWIFEIKWDGFRAIAEVNDLDVELYSRNFLSFNQRFSPIVEALKELHCTAIFDGEIVVIDQQGKSSFQALQNYQNTGMGDLRYYIFDLLYYQGYDLRELPLLQRKELLEKALPKNARSVLQYSGHIHGKGKLVFEEAQKKHLEGLVAKEIHSTYASKRSREWLKIKTHLRQEAVICGFTAPKGSREKFGALILGIYEKGAWQYVGHVGGGFDRKKLIEIMKRLEPLITSESPFKNPPKTNTAVTWVKPKLMCEVSFSEWTKDGSMRQPIFLGLRTDKNPKEVQREMPMSKKTETQLTNLNKVYWPKEGYTKGDLIEYYREVAPYILPYLKDRPQTLHRFPNGIEQENFYQKNVDNSLPKWVPTHIIEHESGPRNYLMISNVRSLLFAINLGCIDLNPFNSRIQKLDYPDYMVLDLDPENVPFETVIETAQVIYDLLAAHDIPSYCKTSGATGLHIYVPLGAQYTYEQAKQFGELLAHFTVQRLPKKTSVERRPSKRQHLVYIDYLQNNFGQTVAAPYCVRPRPGAPVSTPLEWQEVKSGLDPLEFNMKTVPQRLKKKGDIFAPVLKKGINLKKILKKLM